MEEKWSLDPQEHLDPSEEAGGENSNEENTNEEPEEALGMPFGLIGATLLTNILQYAVFLGLTMIILIIIRIFMPRMMLIP